MNDVGLLTRRLIGNVNIDMLNRRLSINFGSIFENAAAQEFRARGFDLHYYSTTQNGEIDFVLQTDRGNVALCEIKSGKDYRRHSALNDLVSVKNYDVAKALDFCDGNVSLRGDVTYLQIYATAFIRDIVS